MFGGLSALRTLPDTPLPPTPDEEAAAANAAVEQMLTQQAQKTAASQQVSQGALGALQGAEAAPAETVSPLTAGISNTLGRLATTIGGPGGKDYAAETYQTRQDQNKLRRDERADNIKRLRATYETAAKAAQEAGDNEAETKTRIAIEKLDTAEKKRLALDKVEADKEAAAAKAENDVKGKTVEFGRDKEMEGIKHGYRLSEIDAKAAKDGAASADDMQSAFEDAVVTTEAVDAKGKPIEVLNTSNFKGKDANNAALKYAAKTGRRALSGKDYEQLKDIQNARANVDNQFNSIQSYLPEGAWNRLAAAPALKLKQAFQSKEDIGAFNAWRTDAINMLRANQGGVGLRITNTEFNVAREGMPKITDTFEVAQRKIEILHTMLAARENLILSKDWRKTQTKAVEQARHEIAALNKGAKPASASGMVRVRTATGQTGSVPSGNVEAWLKDNPGSKKE